MTQPINIMHLSDIHFGVEPKLEDNITSTALARRDIFLGGLIDFISDIEDEWKPDIVVLTGDLGWSGIDSDYKQAAQWLDELLQTLKLTRNDLIICPGNHDINRKKAKFYVRPDDSVQADELLTIENTHEMIRPFEAFNNFCEGFGINNFYIGETKQKQHLYGTCEIKGLRFIVLNSSWFCRDNSDKTKLWLGLPQLEVMKSKGHLVNKKHYNDALVTISLFHHPKEWFNESEYSYYTNRKCAYNYIVEASHIVFNGHVHSSILEPTKEANGAWVFTGGTTYSGHEYRNSFQIAQVDIENRSVTRRAYEIDPRFDTWITTKGRTQYPLVIEFESKKKTSIIENEKKEKYNYSVLVQKAKEYAIRYVEQKSRAITRTSELPQIIKRKVAVHNKEEKVIKTDGSKILLNTYNNYAPLSEMISVARPTFIFGELGSGKSTLVADYISELSSNIEGLVSILIPAGFFRNREIKTIADLTECISEYVDRQLCTIQSGFDLINALRSKHEITIVIDGFDELDKSNARNLLIKVEELALNWTSLRIIATGRPIELQGLNYNNWQCLVTMPLTKEEQRSLLINEALTDGLSYAQATADADYRLKNLYQMSELLSIATTPLTIRLMRPFLKDIHTQKTLGDLLYEITLERLGGWNYKQGKEYEYKEFNRLFPEPIFREKLLGLIAAEMYKLPEKALTKEIIYNIIETEVGNVQDKNLVITQACDFFIKNNLQDSNNTITFDSQPLFQCALGIYIYYKMKSNESINLSTDYSTFWREISFAAAIVRRKNMISELKGKFIKYTCSILEEHKERVLPAVALIISETNENDVALFFLRKLYDLKFRPLIYFRDTKSLSAAAYARWLYLAGDEGFGWFFNQYISPKYPYSVTMSMQEDLILTYWMVYSNFTVSRDQEAMLKSIIEPCIITQSWHTRRFLPIISLITSDFGSQDAYLSLVVKNISSDVIREKVIAILKNEAKNNAKDSVLNALEEICNKNDGGYVEAARLWLELCSNNPPIPIINSVILSCAKDGNEELLLILENRLGHKKMISYLNWCTLKEAKLATAAAIILYKKGECDIFKLGKGLIVGLHDGGKVAGAEEVLEKLVFQNLGQGLRWLVDEFSKSDYDGAHSALWRIFLKGIDILDHTCIEMFSATINHIGQFILPRYPEIRRGFFNILTKNPEYRKVLQNNLNSLDNKLRYNSACLLIACFPEEEMIAAEIIIRSTTQPYNNNEWNGFCMRLALGRKVLDHIFSKINTMNLVPKSFALLLLYYNGYSISNEYFKDIVLGLLDHSSTLTACLSSSKDGDLKNVLEHDNAFDILKESLDDDKLCKEASKVLLLNHYNSLDPELLARCMCEAVDSFDTLIFYKIDVKINELIGNKEFLKYIEDDCIKIREQKSREPIIGIYIRTLQDISAWKDLLWAAMFREDRFLISEQEFERAIMWILEKALADKSIGNCIGLYASQFLQHSSVTSDRVYNYLSPWITLIVHELYEITEEDIKNTILNYNYFEELNTALIYRLGYVPTGYKSRSQVRSNHEQVVDKQCATNKYSYSEIVDILRDSDEIHKEFCILLDKTIIFDLLSDDEINEVSLSSRYGMIFTCILLYCNQELTNYSYIVRIIGAKLSRPNSNNQVAKAVARALKIIKESIANCPEISENYFSAIEEALTVHNNKNVIQLYKELLRYKIGLKDRLLPQLLSELSLHSYHLDGELANMLIIYFLSEINDDNREFVINELKKVISNISSEIEEFPHVRDCLRQWLFSLAFFYLNKDIDDMSERVFLHGVQSAFIQRYDFQRDNSEDSKVFFAKDILSIVFPLLDKVPQVMIRKCILNGTKSDIPEVSSCCKVLLAIMKETHE